MIHPISRELIQAEDLMRKGKYEEALKLLEIFSKSPSFLSVNEFDYLLLKSQLLNRQGNFKKSLSISESLFEKSKKMGEELIATNALITTANSLCQLGKLEKSFDVINQAQQFFSHLEGVGDSKIDKCKSIIFMQKGVILFRKGELESALKNLNKSLSLQDEKKDEDIYARTLNYLGAVFYSKGNYDQALDFYKTSLSIRENIGNKHDIASTLNNIGIIYWHRGALNKALNYFEPSLSYLQTIGNKQSIAGCMNNLGAIYYLQGNLDRSLKLYRDSLQLWSSLNNNFGMAFSYHNIGEVYQQKGDINLAHNFFQKSLAIREATGNKQDIAETLTKLGEVYRQKGELEKALQFLERSLNLQEEIGNKLFISETLFQLINLVLEMGSIELAKKYLDQIMSITKSDPNKFIFQRYQVAQALVLKRSSRSRDRGKAEELLEEVISEEEVMDHDLIVTAMVNLCDLLLHDLSLTEDVGILADVQTHVNKLLQISKHQSSHWLLAETYFLKSKLALLQLNLDETRRLLTMAQSIAEERNLPRLARKISTEHDDLLKQIKRWEELNIEEPSLTERLELARLDDLIEKMLQKREVESPEIIEESPVSLLILADNGLTLYSKPFISETALNNELLGAFLTAIDSFGHAVFSRSLDRIKLEDYTLAMRSEKPFLFCYIFKGQSYAAFKKLNQLMKAIKNNTTLWNDLTNIYNTGFKQEMGSLDTLLEEIFLPL